VSANTPANSEPPAQPRPRRHRLRRFVTGALSGLLAAAAALGVAEFIAAFIGPQSSPVIAIGAAFIEATPTSLEQFAIRTFGSNDKLVLLIGIFTVLGLLAVAMGLLARRVLALGMAGVILLGVVGAAAAMTRPTASPLDAVPSLVGALAGSITLMLLIRAARSVEASIDAELSGDVSFSRAILAHRRFLLLSLGSAALTAVAGTAGRVLLGSRFNAEDSRQGVRLPKPDSPAPSVPAGADLEVPGLVPFFTPNPVFYKVDTTLVTPQLPAAEWSLRVHGMVGRELRLSYEDLLARPILERDITLACVSNEVGGNLVGNARWLGISLADLLREVGVDPKADQIVSRSTDGWTCGTPTQVVMDGRDALLAIGMNGEPLPLDHGFPVRMVVPGLYGYVSACKWLVDLRLTRFADFDSYWVERGWAEQAPIKTASRIDTPRSFAKLSSGTVPIAGVAYAQHRGIDRVEVSIDDGEWQQARLAAEDSIETWRQWVYPWDATPGDHRIEVRATDGTGDTQSQERVTPFPSGATGQHSVAVTVT